MKKNRRGDREEQEKAALPIYVVSGGSGASGMQIVETVLAQFPGSRVPLIRVAQVRHPEQIKEVVEKALNSGGTIVHTLVESSLREALVRLIKKHNIATIDLMGPLLARLSEVLGQWPLGKPGLYRQLRSDYFRRVDAIDFAVDHDDGQKPDELGSADIVLTGVSRCGKTPLSMYLAVQGWKVANVPLVMGIPPPSELFQIDRRRVIGLSIEHEQLMVHRKKRQERMGTVMQSAYTNPSKVFEEIEAAKRIYIKGGFSVVSVTNKPFETIAEDITRLIISFFGDAHPKE